MRIEANTPEEYISKLPEDRQEVISKMREIILQNLPEDFEESMSYGMIGYVVPHEKYPDGYHCDPKQPLPFMSIASQKNFVGLYHMGIYSMPELSEWFIAEYSKQVPTKIDMGKSCIRFKKPEHIPFDLIGELTSKVSAEEWINHYEKAIKK